jgi:hypothetical protein
MRKSFPNVEISEMRMYITSNRGIRKDAIVFDALGTTMMWPIF